MSLIHQTKDGKRIKLSDLELNHLKNIIKRIERKAEEGVKVQIGGGSSPDDFWYDEETYYGEDAKKVLKYYDYKKELEIRKGAK
jgi:hypothetical protein